MQCQHVLCMWVRAIAGNSMVLENMGIVAIGRTLYIIYICMCIEMAISQSTDTHNVL